MSAPHPRRRGFIKPTQSPVTRTDAAPSNTGAPPSPHHANIMPLRKGATFHSPTSPPSDHFDPILHIPSLPRRSPTCPRELDDVVAAGKRRMAALISLSETGSLSTRAQLSRRGEDLPLPRGMLDATVAKGSVTPDDMDVDRPRPSSRSNKTKEQAHHAAHQHASDSGLGSSNGDSTRSASEDLARSLTNSDRLSSSGSAAITRSLAAVNPAGDALQHSLSVHATEQIHKHIILPILSQTPLKDFHPLVRDVPNRIERKEILCLRDLEKTLLLLAPERAKTLAAFLAFCETSIQCLHTTAHHISDRDQRRPTDRPYTNGYFLDLVQQVRQYASEVAAARERQAAGQQDEAMDYSPSERLVAKGGLSQTGHAFRLVREKDGQTLPLSGDREAEAEADSEELSPLLMKRSLSESTEDLARRSMARRRKFAPGEEVSEPRMVCGACQKDFTRRCDLTKHEKTHSRPWKCRERSCRYHTYGWPTEKECDRHYNDKHSDHPDMFECHYGGCTYRSKRESNCKQHMEKAHGWQYVRAKGKKPSKDAGRPSTATPITPQIDTPESMLPPTPHTDASPMTDELNRSFGEYPYDTPGFDGLTFTYPEYHPHVTGPSPHLSGPLDANTMRGQQMFANHDPNWSMFNDVDLFANPQLSTPFPSAEGRRPSTFSQATTDAALPTSSAESANPIPNLSPAGQNVMFTSQYSPADVVEDEGIEADPFPPTGRPTGDFSLYSASQSTASGRAAPSNVAGANMFQDLPLFSGDLFNSQYLQGEYGTQPSQTQIPAQSQAQTQPFLDMNMHDLGLDVDMDVDLSGVVAEYQGQRQQ